MFSIQKRMDLAGSLLAPYAVPLGGLLGRAEGEPLDETRFPFQRDRDRLIHTQAFRRLQGKTQVFVAGEGDHYRTRLTHTMEVAQIGRDIARTLRLNEDLAECIALGHDLGHPPFGHSGEEALDAWMRTQGGSFEHNRQSLRIVTILEEHSSHHQGLNLNGEVLEGLMKHREDPESPQPMRGLSLEAQAVDCADQIAYTAHDCDDGIDAGLFRMETVTDTKLAKEAAIKASKRHTSLRGALIHLLTEDLYQTTENFLKEKNIRSLDEIYQRHLPLVTFSEEMSEKLRELRAFLWQHMYLHPSVQSHNDEGQHVVASLCDRYRTDPPEKILRLQERTRSQLPEAVKDYVAGMTDHFAHVQAD